MLKIDTAFGKCGGRLSQEKEDADEEGVSFDFGRKFNSTLLDLWLC